MSLRASEAEERTLLISRQRAVDANVRARRTECYIKSVCMQLAVIDVAIPCYSCSTTLWQFYSTKLSTSCTSSLSTCFVSEL